MKVINGLSSISRQPNPVILTIGNFDGLHLGHRALVGQVIETARKSGSLATVLCFDPHPTRILKPEAASPKLFSAADFIEQLKSMNLDQVIIEPFTLALSRQSAAEFVNYLLKHLMIIKLCIGHDFKFGHDRDGDERVLSDLGKLHGFEIVRVPAFDYEGEIVSSSLIRKKLQAGEIERAAKLLSRPYYIEGHVVSGDGRGHKLGFATANLACSSEVIPAAGVYVTYFEVDGQRLESITNVGYKPTFHSDNPLSVETHVFNKDISFLEKNVRVIFLKRLRDEMKFASAEKLIEQIKIDVNLTKKYFEAL